MFSRWRPRVRLLVPISLTAAISAACSLVRPHEPRLTTAAPLTQPVSVHVTDDNLLDVDVYAVGHGEELWLGRATSLTPTTFRLPEWFANHGAMRILVDPVGASRRYYSDPVFVHRGEELDLMVSPTDIALSSLSVLPVRHRSTDTS